MASVRALREAQLRHLELLDKIGQDTLSENVRRKSFLEGPAQSSYLDMYYETNPRAAAELETAKRINAQIDANPFDRLYKPQMKAGALPEGMPPAIGEGFERATSGRVELPSLSNRDVLEYLDKATKLKPINQLQQSINKENEMFKQLGTTIDNLYANSKGILKEELGALLGGRSGLDFVKSDPKLASKIASDFIKPEMTDDTKEYEYNLRDPRFLTYKGKAAAATRAPQEPDVWMVPGSTEPLVLAKGQMPPKGSVPYKDTSQGLKDFREWSNLPPERRKDYDSFKAAGKDLETWVDPGVGLPSAKNLPVGAQPPQGYVKYQQTPEGLKDFMAFTRLPPDKRREFADFRGFGKDLVEWVQLKDGSPDPTTITPLPPGFKPEGDGWIKATTASRGSQLSVTSPDGSEMTMQTGGFQLGKQPKQEPVVSPATRAQLEKDVVSLTEQLNALAPTLKNYSKDYLTYYGRAKNYTLNEMSKAGWDLSQESQDFVNGSRLVTEGLEYVFNLYRKNITGAQAVMKELDMLRDSILNKKLSPAQFNASVDRFISLGSKAINLRLTMLKEGVSEKTINSALDDLIKKKIDQQDKKDEGNFYDQFWKKKGK